MNNGKTASADEAPTAIRERVAEPKGGSPAEAGRVERLLRFPKEEIRFPELVERFGYDPGP